MDPKPAYVEVFPGHQKGADVFALVEGRHKIISVSLEDSSTVLLYDLENDPGEKNNLADIDPALTDSLLIEMELWEEIARHHSVLDSSRLEYFRSLGYINQ
ncbi:MAG: hypothetical protein JSW58_00780 [Candidatus Latescibacterota bacterium]|nr:MAG: hypothetical protein JSW58_00780 [Candidatus Latescibacterota bacterium]